MFKDKKGNISQLSILQMLLQQLWMQDSLCRRRIIYAAIISVVALILKAVTPLTIKVIVDALQRPPSSVGIILTLILMSYGLTWLIANAAGILRQIIMYRVFERSISNLILKLFKHLNTLSLSYHLSRKTGVITNAIDKALVAIPKVLWGFLFSILPTILEIFVAVIVLAKCFGISYGMMLLVGLLIYTGFSFVATQWAVNYQRKGNVANKETMSYLVDRLLNFETLKNSYSLNSEIEKCKGMLNQRENAMTNQLVYMDLIGMGQIFIMGSMLTLLTWYTGLQVFYKNSLTVGDFIMINAYVMQFVAPMNLFGYILRQMRQGLTEMENVVEILSEQNIVMDHPHAKPIVVSAGTISFKDICFSHIPKVPILQNFNLDIEGGKSIALMGPSGSGKTTLLRLLLRLYEPESGQIFIDKQDISLITQESLKSNIAVVPQNPVLFNSTIFANIACDNHVSTQEVNEVMDLLKMKEWISHLPMGYDTIVGEQGVKLSGGEKQRVLIARALLKNAKIFIFDEATASLDYLSESSITQGIKKILSNATIIAISHKYSAVKDFDKVVCLDKGKIVEEVFV